MNTENEKKNLADKIGILIYMVNIIIAMLLIFPKFSLIPFFIKISIFIFMVFVVEPLNNYFKTGSLKNKTIISGIISKIILTTIFIISLYKSLLSNNYDLKYTYWICFISLLMLLILKMIERYKNSYNRTKVQGKKPNKIFLVVSILLYAMIYAILIYFLIGNYIYPSRNIKLDDVKRPEYILVSKCHNDEFGQVSIDASAGNKIDSFKELDKIVLELNSVDIKNITTTDLLNYKRKTSNKDTYYNLKFSYKDVSSKDSRLEDGYIDIINITSDGDITIEVMQTKKNIILGSKVYKEIFPISLSKEAKDILSKYLE